jgi:hypothetical protein
MVTLLVTGLFSLRNSEAGILCADKNLRGSVSIPGGKRAEDA